MKESTDVNCREGNRGESAPKTEVWAFRMLLKDGMAETYRQRHDEIWPELAQALLAAGVLDFRIYLDADTGILFATMSRRTDNTLQALRASPIMQKWWAMMSDIMETHADLSPREWPLVPMFHLSAVG